MATVWVKGADGKPVARKITTGLNDGNYAQVTGGELAAGDLVIVGLAGTLRRWARGPSMPGMGGPMGGGRGDERPNGKAVIAAHELQQESTTWATWKCTRCAG